MAVIVLNPKETIGMEMTFAEGIKGVVDEDCIVIIDPDTIQSKSRFREMEIEYEYTRIPKGYCPNIKPRHKGHERPYKYHW